MLKKQSLSLHFLFVCLFFSGLHQYLVSETKDAGHTEREESFGQAGVEKSDSHRTRRVQAPVQCILKCSCTNSK